MTIEGVFKYYDKLEFISESFEKDCYEYHHNEFLPKLMFQDWGEFPSSMISECVTE